MKPIYIFLLSILFAGCADNYESILDKADIAVRTYPDSALLLLSEIELPQQLEGKQKADYWRIRSQVHRQSYKAMTTDSLILYSLNYYLANKDTVKTIESYFLASAYYQWIEQPDSAFRMLSSGFAQAEAIGDTANISKFLYRLGSIQAGKKNYEKATEYFKRQTRYQDNHNAYYLAALYVYDDSTKYYIEKAIELALQAKDTISATHYIRNYAGTMLTRGDYVKTIELIKQTGELYDFYKDFGANHQMMTEIYINKNKLDSAQIYLDKASKEKTKHSRGGHTNTNMIGTENALSALQAIIETKQNKRLDLTRMYQFNDSIIVAINKKNSILGEQISEKNNLEQANLKLIIQRQRTQTILISCALVLVLLSIGLYLYFLNRRRKIEEVEERSESLQRMFRDALTVKDEKESNSRLFRKTLLQQLGIIRLIATSPTKQNQELLRQIVDISNEAVSTDSLLQWRDLYPIIDSIYDSFYTRLCQKYGDVLIEKEIQLCCLLCADFSTNEISAIMQQSIQTIYQRKSSIRKKTEMGEKEDIISFIKEQY